MTPAEELRMMKMEDQLAEASSTIQYLWDCLDHPPVEGVTGGVVHAYPEQTQAVLDSIRTFVPEREYCIHSNTRRGIEQGCKSCIYFHDRYHRQIELQELIDADHSS